MLKESFCIFLQFSGFQPDNFKHMLTLFWVNNYDLYILKTLQGQFSNLCKF